MYLYMNYFCTLWWCIISIYLIFTSQMVIYFWQSTLVLSIYMYFDQCLLVNFIHVTSRKMKTILNWIDLSPCWDWNKSVLVKEVLVVYWCDWVANISPFNDDVIKWKHFPRNWPFVRGIHRSPVKSPHKGQWRGALMFSLICVWINGWVNDREAGDLRRYRAHYDVTVIGISEVIPNPGWTMITPQQAKSQKKL